MSKGKGRADGMMEYRRAWFGACSDSASETPGRSETKLRMRGTMPTVDTVTLLGRRPTSAGSTRRRTALHTAL